MFERGSHTFSVTQNCCVSSPNNSFICTLDLHYMSTSPKDERLCSPPPNSGPLSYHIFALPSDVFRQLLLFANIDGVLRCCCVCKSWKEILSLDMLKKLFYDEEFDLPKNREFTKEYLQVIINSFQKLRSITYRRDVVDNLNWAVSHSQARFAIRTLKEAVRRGLQSGIPFETDRLYALGSVELAKLTLELFPLSPHQLFDIFDFANGNVPIMHLLLDSASAEHLKSDIRVVAKIAQTGDVELFQHLVKVCGSLEEWSDYIVYQSITENNPTDLFCYLFNDLKWFSPHAFDRAILHRPEIAEVILQGGFRPKSTYIEFCATQGHRKAMELLLKYGTDFRGDSALLIVLRDKPVDLVASARFRS
eukprot:TRINITY_DN9326_c0_g1_i1.p1 TRINITY_DN9326_c0_g1~~TRINITY_DN9326_c0_g1_i1.p1  ORF type:complete len:363 (+),score=31.47 TRINITY_DN9326_c0_g1_i1:124-1212(+)